MTLAAAAGAKPQRRLSPRRVPKLSVLTFGILLLTVLLRPSFPVDALASPPRGAPERGGASRSNNTNRGDAKRTKTKAREYNYFAYGSNMCSATMTALRGLNPLASTAAVLPGHELRFNVPGTPLVEPSWASVEPVVVAADRNKGDDPSSSVVHGVLYRLTEGDFASVLRSEGVPLGYSVHRCRAVPYRGDGANAGKEALRAARRRSASSDGDGGGGGESSSSRFVPAYTLRAARRAWRSGGADAAPSRSYLDVLTRGGVEFGLDGSYVDYLRGIEAGPTPLTPGGDGMAMAMLEAAEARANGGSFWGRPTNR